MIKRPIHCGLVSLIKYETKLLLKLCDSRVFIIYRLLQFEVLNAVNLLGDNAVYQRFNKKFFSNGARY